MEGVRNFRKVESAHGNVFRSAQLHQATANDVDVLLRKWKIKTILDLRSTSEVKPSQLASDLLKQFIPILPRRKASRRGKVVVYGLICTVSAFLLYIVVFAKRTNFNSIVGVIGGAIAFYYYNRKSKYSNETTVVINYYDNIETMEKEEFEQQKVENAKNSNSIHKVIRENQLQQQQQDQDQKEEKQQLKYIHFPLLNDNVFLKAFIPLLERRTQLRLLYLFLTHQSEAIKFEGAFHLGKLWDLGDLYINIIEHSKKELLAALEILSDGRNYPIIVHCTHGKDRTGVLIALMLSALGVSNEEIIKDYIKSADDPLSLDVKLPQNRHVPVHWLLAEPKFLERMINHIEYKYGGMILYLDSIGFVASKREALKGKKKNMIVIDYSTFTEIINDYISK